MPVNGRTYPDGSQKNVHNGSINNHRRSVCSSRDSADNESLMV